MPRIFVRTRFCIATIFVVAGASCSQHVRATPNGFNKFDPTYRAGKAVETATEIGVNYQTLGDRVLIFATELSIAQDQDLSDGEKDVADKFVAALAAYKDSLQIWNWRIQHGVVLATYHADAIAPMMEKYGVQKYSTGNWNAEDALQATWKVARTNLEVANGLYLSGLKGEPRREGR
jgi:hypothetical protein